MTPLGRSRRLDRALTDFGCEDSFAKAAARVKEHYGFEIPVSAVVQATFKHAQRAHQKLENKYAEPFRILPAVGEPWINAQTDGTMICTVPPGKRKAKRPREWKEMRLVAARAHEQVATVYGATFADVAAVGRRWGHGVRDVGWGLNSRIHVVGDGAEWIRLQAKEVFGRQGTFLCDFYHVSEYLGAAAPGCRPPHPDRWRRTQQARLKRGACAQVVGELAAHLEAPERSEEEAPVRGAHRYLSNRLDCLDYAGAIKLGLPIGSGLIESGHRHVLQARLKNAGTAWLAGHAQWIASIRVIRSNGQWNNLWN